MKVHEQIHKATHFYGRCYSNNDSLETTGLMKIVFMCQLYVLSVSGCKLLLFRYVIHSIAEHCTRGLSLSRFSLHRLWRPSA